MPKNKCTYDEWFETAAGQELLKSEALCLAKIIRSKWGDHLLQIGGPEGKVLRDLSPIIHQVCFNPVIKDFEEASLVLVDYDELALLPESVDVILLPHVLENTAKPDALLAELYQALKPEGLLILFCFNPSGLGSLWYLDFMRQKIMPRAKWRSAYRLMEMLQAVGFSKINRYSAGFHLPFAKKKTSVMAWQTGLAWLFPTVGAVTVLSAKKEEIAALLTVEWNAKPNVGMVQNRSYDADS